MLTPTQDNYFKPKYLHATWRNYKERGNQTLKLMHQSPMPYCQATRKCLNVMIAQTKIFSPSYLLNLFKVQLSSEYIMKNELKLKYA